jgi:putative ABC transport system permease protein
LTLIALLLWIAADFRLGLIVAAGFGCAMLLFAGASWAVLLGLDRLIRAGRGGVGRGGWRYGLAALGRRRASSVLQAVAIGLGLMVLLVLTVVRADLLDQWRGAAAPDTPNRFLINVQPAQADAVQALLVAEGVAAAELFPMIRGRLVAINGKPVDPDAFEGDRARRLAEREFNLSHGSELQYGNRVVAGTWHGTAQAPQFSVEKGLAETFRVAVGDRVTFDVAGRHVEAPISSVRSLDWDSMRVNFFFVGSPGLLAADAASLITSFYLPGGREDFNARLVAAFPNVSVIDLSSLLAQLRSLMDRLSLVVQGVVSVALAAGIAVLLAGLQATHEERAYELAMLRTLGARNRQLHGAVLAEFAVLGLVAGVLAGRGAMGVGWLLAEYAFKLPSYRSAYAAVVLGGALGAAGVLFAGWAGVRPLLGRPPGTLLRGAG